MCPTYTVSQYLLPEFETTVSPQMPKGIFHYRKTETGLKNEFKVPEAEISDPAQLASELINTAVAESSHRQEAVSGLQIPLPFGLDPLNIQLNQDSETKIGVDHESSTISPEDSSTVAPSENRRLSPELDFRARKALERARKICLRESQKKCDLVSCLSRLGTVDEKV